MQFVANLSGVLNSLLAGNLAGNFPKKRFWSRFLRTEYEHDQKVSAKFPARKEQGILALEQGILSSEQGLSNRGAGYCVSVHFSHTCSGSDESDLFSPSI
jgi:hypothetical protein